MKINSSQNVTLAIAPGKRELGVAVFINSDLVYMSVKTLRSRKPDQPLFDEIAEIMRGLFDSFAVNTVVIKALSQYQKLSSDLKRIVERIKYESSLRGLRLEEITLEQIKSVLSKGERMTEKKAFEALLASYPQLERYWNRPNKWQNDYYAFLFSAVAAGTVYLKTHCQGE